MLEFFVAGDDFIVMVQSPTLGLFKLRLSDFWLWSHIDLRGIHTVTFRSSLHSGGSGFSWPMLTHGCCQRQGKVALLLGVRVSMLAITFLFRISSRAHDNVL